MNQIPISVLAFIVSLIALSWTIYSNIRQRKQASTMSNLNQVINVEKELVNTPTALRFHGIEQKELEEIGLTPEEFIYLLTNFTFGRTYYEINMPNSKTP